MKRLVIAAALACIAVTSANADVILGGQTWTGAGSETINLVTGAVGNQPNDAPCLICGASQPQQPAGFGYNDFSSGGNITSITAFSDQGNGGRNTLLDNTFNNTLTGGYQIGDGSLFKAFLLAHGDTNVNLAFNIGVDVNDTNQAQTLNSFFFLDLTTHTVLASYLCIVNCTVPSLHNGTGFPDYTLTGFSLNGVNPGDEIIFAAHMTGLNDGPDSFFLEPAAAAVPAPIVGAGLPGLLGGLFALAGLAWRRRSSFSIR
jgi:opacity protein-like surface antigen